jgi:APA family basic amino acid/polyamine antiporter
MSTVVGVKNSKILQTVLTVIKILSLAGLIVFGFYGCQWRVWDATTGPMLGLKTECRNRLWLPISGTALIWYISAALWVRCSSVAWEGVLLLVKLKSKTQCGIEFV